MQPSSTLQKYLHATERIIETVVFASRWLLAPFYVGLCLSIVVLLIKFMAELFHLMHEAFSITEPEVIVGVLSLVDMALTGSLLIIVIFSGYENFVSRIDHEGHRDWPAWMGTIDFSTLKLKLLSSIVAISAIQLLKQFMALDKVSDRDLYFLIIIHVVFVVSSVFLALADRIAGGGGHGHGNGHGTPSPVGGASHGAAAGQGHGTAAAQVEQTAAHHAAPAAHASADATATHGASHAAVSEIAEKPPVTSEQLAMASTHAQAKAATSPGPHATGKTPTGPGRKSPK